MSGTAGTFDGAPRRVSALSPSSIALWEQCPRRFWFEKVQGRGSKPGPEAVLGTFVHRVLELLMQVGEGERTVEVARDAARRAWAELQLNADWAALGIELGSPEALAFRRRAWFAVRGYFEMEDPNSVRVEATEQLVEATIAGVPLRGIVDRLDRDVFDDLVVVDYKSGRVPHPRFIAAKARQILLYAALVAERFGERPVEGRLLFVSFGRVVEVRVTEESVDEALCVAFETWEAVDRALRFGGFEERPGPLCGWCPFVSECSEGLVEIRRRRAAGRLGGHAPNFDLAANPETVDDRVTEL